MALFSGRTKKVIIMIAIVLLIFAVGFFAYIYITISSIPAAPRPMSNQPFPTVKAFIDLEDLLSYNLANSTYPFLKMDYNVTRVSKLYINSTIYKYKVPQTVYILNYTNDCYRCGNVSQTVADFKQQMKLYGLSSIYDNVSYIPLTRLDEVQNNSILIVLNGLLPNVFFEQDGSTTVLGSLLARHISIIYVGMNFSDTIVAGSTPTIVPVSTEPAYLKSSSTPMNKITKSDFSFTNPTFFLVDGSQYGDMSYENYSNGSIVVFSNTLLGWSTPQLAANDIAKAVFEMFWLPKYAQGYTNVNIPSNSTSSSVGMILNSFPVQKNPNLTVQDELNSGFLRVLAIGTASYNNSRQGYSYIERAPAFYTRGTLIMQPSIQPNQTGLNLQFNITWHPSHPVNLSTYIEIYNNNLSRIETLRGVTIHNFSAAPNGVFLNSSFIIPNLNFDVGPGNYIVALRNFSDNTEIASGYFTVKPITIYFIGGNVSTPIFVLGAKTSGGQLNGINYRITLNNQYPQNGTVINGRIVYRPPSGTVINGKLNFTVYMLGEKFPYDTYYYTLPFTINTQYVEIGIVVMMVLIMVIFVKAPARDEFYVDLPNLPEEKKTEIILKANDLISVFDKLNTSYHWKYMPLSRAEFKAAVGLNIKYNNIPVELTYNNIESVLDSMTVNNYIVSADSLYAPKSWIDASHHDISYLATFKKLRIYFVTHRYMFSDLDESNEADIVAVLGGEKKYIVIHSDTSKFRNIPVYKGYRTYLVFLNSYTMEDFRSKLYDMSDQNAERLRIYLSSDYIRLVDGDRLERDIS